MSGNITPPSRNTPHIRLNSGRQDPFADMNSPTQGTSAVQSPVARSLIPQAQQSPNPALQSPALQTQGSFPIYGSPSAPESSELLIPPRSHRPRDDLDSPRSPDQSMFSSRRTSWSSEVGSRDSRSFPYNPFEDSRAPSRAESDDNDVNTQTVSEKYNIMPTEGLLLFPEDVEKDDYLHNPDPNDKDRDCDVCNPRGLANVGGLAIFTLGLLTLFIAYPILTFVRKLHYDPSSTICAGDPMCLDVGEVPLLKNIRTGLIDPDTPDSVKTITAANGEKWDLVFSDEFNQDGRTFFGGDDPYFQGVDIWYGVTQDLEWYDPDAITTKDGVMEIRFDAFQNHNVNYRSGMLQSWNQLCFKGGRLEASISLPGRGDTSGFWPGFWAMGNLGRPGYAATTDGMWPYSYDDVCDAGITANQSSTDGISYLPGMRLPACTCPNADHPSPGRSRSAPEIDVIEASVKTLNEQGFQIGDVSQSLQIAPFDIWYMPDYDFAALYNPQITEINNYRGGPYQQAMSALTNLNNEWYDGKEYQLYAFEYTPGADGDLTWFVGQDKTWAVDGRSIGPNGNIGQRVIPVEPMAIVVNFGMSNSFSSINMTGIAELLPATMRIDYIRIYQDPANTNVTCDPPGYETTSYITHHPEAYSNPNLTHWAQTPYDWPKNSLVNGC